MEELIIHAGISCGPFFTAVGRSVCFLNYILIVQSSPFEIYIFFAAHFHIGAKFSFAFPDSLYYIYNDVVK